MENFINQARQAFREATGQIPNDEIVSRYSLAYQIQQLNQNIEAFLINEGVLEVETQTPEDSAKEN